MTLSFYLLIFFSPCSLPFPHSSGEEEEEGTIIFIIAEAPGLLHSGLIVNGHLGHPWIGIAGEETPKLKIPIFKKILVLKQICHYLLWCCRAKMRLLSPGRMCLVCCPVPLVCNGCRSWPLSPWLVGSPVSPKLNRFIAWEMCPAGLPLPSRLLFSTMTGSFRVSTTYQKTFSTLKPSNAQGGWK